MTMTVSQIEPDQDKSVLANTLESIPIGVVMIDQSGRIELVNAELESQFGYSRNELYGKPIELLVPDSVMSNHPDARNEYLTKPVTRSMGLGTELFAQRKDKSQFPVEIGLNPVSFGNKTSVVATVVDITKRKQQEKNFESIIMSAPIGMLMVDQTGTIQLANTHLLTLFGYEKDELIGKSLECMLPERYRESHVNTRNEFMSNPVARVMGPGRDLTGLHKNGTELPVEIGLSPVEVNSGIAFIATITNVAERKKMELDLRSVNADLDEFTYVASHDLKSPLRGIASLIEWIEEDLDGVMTEDVANNLNRVHLRIHRMEALIEDLLNYARAGRRSGQFAEIKLSDMFDNVITLLDPPAEYTIKIDCQVDSIQSAKAPIETVMRNLLSNAIKHHDREHGEITITVTESDSNCIFSVCDDGPGIPEAAHERIFKLFQTLATENNTRSGVGLAVTKRLIDAHDGEIEIISSEDQRGTCFRFSWPRFARSDLNE